MSGAERVARKGVSKGMWISARAGHVAKGVVYAIIGVLAVQAALGQGQATDGRGALQQIAREPFGRILLVLTGIGLFAYLVWSFIQAIADADNDGSDAKGLIKRIGYSISGLAHGALGFTAFQLAFGSGGGGAGNAQSMTAWLMQQPFGRWLVAIVGVVLVGNGIGTIIVGAKKKFKRKLTLSRMKATEKTWAVRAGVFGLIALGFVFGLVGGFLIYAAVQAQPEEAQGVGGVLRSLLQQSHGPWLLGVVALGLIAYGIYMLVLARYRRIPAGH